MEYPAPSRAAGQTTGARGVRLVQKRMPTKIHLKRSWVS